MEPDIGKQPVGPDLCQCVRAGKIGWLGFKHLVIACLATQITLIGHPGGVLIRKWLRVLGTTERSQINQRICHQLHAIVPLLDAFKPQQQPLECILPCKDPLHLRA